MTATRVDADRQPTTALLSIHADLAPSALPVPLPPARQAYESRLRQVREAPTSTPFGIAKRARRLAPEWAFDPDGHCVLCGVWFWNCEHSELENQWAIAVVRWKIACL